MKNITQGTKFNNGGDVFPDGVNIKGGREGVHLTLSREGRPSGEAYIEVTTEEDVAAAEKKHNQHMGRRYIEGTVT